MFEGLKDGSFGMKWLRGFTLRGGFVVLGFRFREFKGLWLFMDEGLGV